jgi:hypothetical protein
MMTLLRKNHEMRKVKAHKVYNLEDQFFKGDMPDDRFDLADNPNLPLELRKAFSINYQEEQHKDRPVFDRESGEIVAGYEEVMK